MNTAHTRAADVEGRDIAAIAGLLADRTRASFCLALLDGRAWTASELAHHAGVVASTATGHLNLMVASGLLVQQRQGRHRYVRLAGPDIADLLQGLGALAPRSPATVASFSAAGRRDALAQARTCYDHLAGTLAVAITDALTERGLLTWEGGLAMTADGMAWLAGLGITLPGRTPRPVARSCLDWTERRPHLAGAVGAALCGHALNAGWVRRIGTSRAVVVTATGRAALLDHLGICNEDLGPTRLAEPT
jgi:DNA-binding transcriptional ArsR family regulator